MMMTRKSFLVVKGMMFLGFLLIWVVSCGSVQEDLKAMRGDEDHGKSGTELLLKGSEASNPVEYSVQNLLPSLYSYDGGYSSISNEEVQKMAEAALAEKIRQTGLIPTEIAEFFKFELILNDLEGCDELSTSTEFIRCEGSFSFKVTLTATAGPDILDTVTRDVYIQRLEKSQFKRRLRWTINLLIDIMIENGTLEEMGIHIETPYY